MRVFDTLPNEILMEIFLVLKANEKYKIVTVTTVCSRWRAVAIGCPNLWTMIDFEKPGWSLHLSRSGGATLTLTGKSLDGDYRAVFLGLTHRVHECRLLWAKSHEVDHFFSLLENALPPALTKLTVSSRDFESVILHLNLPSLKELSLSGREIRWDSKLGDLTRLKLLNHDETATPSIIQVLGGMPKLQFLHLTSPPLQEIEDHLPPANLPCLNELHLHCFPFMTCVMYKSYLAIPPSAHVCLSGSGRPTADEISEVLRLVLSPTPEGYKVVLSLDFYRTKIKIRPGSESTGSWAPPTLENGILAGNSSPFPGTPNILEIRYGRDFSLEDWWSMLSEVGRVSALSISTTIPAPFYWHVARALAVSKPAEDGTQVVLFPDLHTLQFDALCCRYCADPDMPDMPRPRSRLLELIVHVRKEAGARVRDLKLLTCHREVFGDMRAVEKLVDRVDYCATNRCV